MYTNNHSYEVLLWDDIEGLSSKAQTLLRENATLISEEDISEEKYMASLDFWLGFDPSLANAEPAREVLTAMASGVVVILPPEQRPVYGDAALYCDAKEVQNVVSRAWDNKDFYNKQVLAGVDFSSNFLSEDEFVERVRKLGVVPLEPLARSQAQTDSARQEEVCEFEGSEVVAKEVE